MLCEVSLVATAVITHMWYWYNKTYLGLKTYSIELIQKFVLAGGIQLSCFIPRDVPYTICCCRQNTESTHVGFWLKVRKHTRFIYIADKHMSSEPAMSLFSICMCNVFYCNVTCILSKRVLHPFWKVPHYLFVIIFISKMIRFTEMHIDICKHDCVIRLRYPSVRTSVSFAS